MKPIYKIFATIILLILVNSVKSQDIHFTKFYDAPLILNPANTGNYEGNWRLLNNYRQQGDQVMPYYTTTTIALDHPIYIKSEKASIGFTFIHDNSSVYSFFSNKIYFSSAYFVKTTANSYLHMGLQAGYVFKNVNNNKLSFPDQFDRSIGAFNPNMHTNETMQKQFANYLDLSWGLIYSYVLEKCKIEMGVAMFHYNKPIESFLNEKNRLSPKYSSHVYYQQKLANNYYLKPIMLFAMQNRASELLSGVKAGLKTNSKTFKDINIGLLYRGGFLRTQDAVITQAGFDFKNYTISVAYDINIMSKKELSYSGNAFEISLTFNRPSTDLGVHKIKCDIF